MSWGAVTAALTRVGALIGLRPASAAVLSLGQRARPGWGGSARVTNFRAAVILLPILLLAGFAWWTERNVHEASNERAQRIVSALADHTRRVLDVQETMLKSALARVRGRAADEIAADASLPAFLAHLGISGELMIVESETKRILASSRKGARGEAGIHVGELTSEGTAGETGFTVRHYRRIVAFL